MTILKALLAVAYAVAIAGVAATAIDEPAAEPKKEPVKAASDLARNHLLQARDLSGDSASSLVGRYTARPLAGGAEVAATDVSRTPALDGKVALLGLPVAAKLVAGGDANSGRPVYVCAGTQQLAWRPTVEAVLCAAKSETCTALVRAAGLPAGSDPGALRAASATCDLQPADNADSSAPAPAPTPTPAPKTPG